LLLLSSLLENDVSVTVVVSAAAVIVRPVLPLLLLLLSFLFLPLARFLAARDIPTPPPPALLLEDDDDWAIITTVFFLEINSGARVRERCFGGSGSNHNSIRSKK